MSTLTESEEEMIVVALKEFARRGLPCVPEKAKLMVQSWKKTKGQSSWSGLDGKF